MIGFMAYNQLYIKVYINANHKSTYIDNLKFDELFYVLSQIWWCKNYCLQWLIYFLQIWLTHVVYKWKYRAFHCCYERSGNKLCTFIKIEESKVNYLPLLNALKNMPFSYSYLTLNLLILITKPFGKYVYEFINIIIIWMSWLLNRSSYIALFRWICHFTDLV